MSLVRCQLEPQLRRLDTTVTACAPAGPDRWHVRLEETVLYPEGGGQPADHGTIAGAPVVDVQRDDQGVAHTTTAPVPLGPAPVVVDWARRFDHMQQHSAQHLITALAHDGFGRPTVAFHLGATGCTIDLEGPPLTDAERATLQAQVNAAIREARPITHRAVDPATYRTLEVRSRGLPEGHAGQVRLVEIDGLDCNTCGGTHVATTAELQAVVLERAEAIPGGTRLHYLAGGRVIDGLTEALDRQRALTDRLTAPPVDHLARVTGLLEGAKAAAKARLAVERELAGFLGAQLAESADATRHLHRDGADLGVLRAIADAAQAARPDQRLLLTGDGVFLVAGPADAVQAAGPAVAAALGGRGGGRGSRYQGKAAALDQAAVALEHLREAP